MKKILVTGATGFIGSYVINQLLPLGYEVVASSRNEKKAKASNWFTKVHYVPFNINQADDENCYELFGKPDLAIHLAWDGLPDYKSLQHFETYLFENYRFLKNLVMNGLADLTVTGTCFEYGMKTGELFESDQAEPSNPYGLAKFTLYKFLEQLRLKKEFRLKWVRLFYMYGNGQNPKSLFAQLDNALEQDQKVFNMSGGEQLRDFLPVDQVGYNISRIAVQSRVTGIINCCSGRPVSVKDLVLSYLASANKRIELNLGYYPYPDYEPMAFWGNNKKLQSILNE